MNTPPPIPPSNEQDQYQNQSTNPPESGQPPQQQNPYAAPNMSSMAQQPMGMYDEGHFGLLSEPRKCEAGRGLTWVTSAFGIFKDNWLLWLAMSLVFSLILIGLSVIPLVSLLVNLVIFHFVGSFMVIAAKQEEGQEVAFGDMFSAFQTHLVPLLVLALIYFVLIIIVFIPVIVILMMTVGFSAFTGSDPSAFSDGSIMMIMIGFLITLGLFVPLIMSVYLAPALIVLHDIKPVKAMKMSFMGCLKNIIPFLLLGIVLIFVLPLAVIFSLGLALLVISPVIMISYYTSYRDIWTNRMMGQF